MEANAGADGPPAPPEDRIVAVCTIQGCLWVRMRLVSGDVWEGELPRALPPVQEGAGVVCPAHLPKIEAACTCRRRRIDGTWETNPLPWDISIAATVPEETCPVCTPG